MKSKKNILSINLFLILFCIVLVPHQLFAKSLNILVHPFQYRGPENYSWLTRGITDTVISDLMKIKSFNVFSESDRRKAIRELELGMAGAIDDRDIAKLGSLVGADIIFTGRVQVINRKVRISARLVDVKSAKLFKSLKLDGPVKNILRLQDRVVIELLEEKEKIDITDLPPLVISEKDRKIILDKPKRNFNAYEYYSMGLENQITDMAKALEYFKKAFALDPNYFEAYLEASLTAGKLAEREIKKRNIMMKLEERYLEKAANIIKNEKRCEYKYAYILMMKGISLGKQHKIEMARKLLFKAEEILKCLGQEKSTNYATLMIDLGNTCFVKNDHSTSLKYYKKAKSIYSDLNLEVSIGYADSMVNIANVYSDREQYKKGLEIYFEAQKIRNKLREKNPELYDPSLVNIGTIYRLMNKYPEALKYYRDAMDMIEELDIEDTYKHATLLINFAAYYEERGNRKKAARMYRKAYAVYTELGYEGPLKKLARERARKNERGR